MITTHNFKNLIRWDEWGDSKLPFIILAWLVVSLQNPLDPVNLGVLLQVLGFSACYLAFGYLFNDWMDREPDIKAGKIKLVHRLRSGEVSLILVILTLIGLLCILPWLTNLTVLVILLTSYFLAITYSGTPLRFKERGELGLLVATLSQRTLPASLVFAIIGQFDALAVLFLLLTIIIGLRWMITHQIEDYDRDQISQVKTYIGKRGINYAIRQLVWLLNVEILLVMFLGLILASPLVWLLYCVYVIWTLAMSVASSSTPWQMLRVPATSYLVLADFYFLYWPLGLTVIYSISQPLAWIVVILLSALLIRHIRQNWAAMGWLLSYFMEQHGN